MKQQSIITSFTRDADDELDVNGSHIVDCLKADPVFAKLQPPIAEVDAACTTYRIDLLASKGLGRAAVAQKNKSRKAVENVLKLAGLGVIIIANGDTVILSKSGFKLTKQPQARYVASPGSVTLSNGRASGQLVASLAKVEGATGYFHEISAFDPAEKAEWVRHTGTRLKVTFTNLEPGKEYWVRVAATGPSNEVYYSLVVSQFVQ